MAPTKEDKAAAFSFLGALERHLNNYLPAPAELAKEVAAIVQESKRSGSAPHTAFAEGAFLNVFVAPHLHEFLAKRLGTDDARLALLSEAYRRIPGYASGTPARPQLHPFSKVIGVQPRAVMKQWRTSGRRSLVRSCPDLALRPPCQHKIVFEGKYFSTGGVSVAETALATGIYQAFFYRGLPSVPETSRRRGWDYDYACLLAYDTTEDGSLLKAWATLDRTVQRQGLWDGASIYVMILRGG
jgi:hypothetical protein